MTQPITVTDDLRHEFAPTGRLRVALNHGNRVLVSPFDAPKLAGITVDLAHALAERLGVEVEFIHKKRAIDVSSVAADDVYDICFLAVDPARAETIDFTDPYVAIEGSYLAAPACPATGSAQLVADALPVATVDGSAYTLHLSRQPGAEHLVHFPSLQMALAALDRGEVMALAGIGTVMQIEADKRPGARILTPPFMEIRQAMGIPSGRPDAADYLSAFVREMAVSGEVGKILERHGVSADCAVIPD